MEAAVVVSPRVRATITTLIKECAMRAGEQGMLEVIGELEWLDHASYSPEGKLRISSINDLQQVALAAALDAYLEAIGRKR